MHHPRLLLGLSTTNVAPLKSMVDTGYRVIPILDLLILHEFSGIVGIYFFICTYLYLSFDFNVYFM